MRNGWIHEVSPGSYPVALCTHELGFPSGCSVYRKRLLSGTPIWEKQRFGRRVRVLGSLGWDRNFMSTCSS